MKATQGIKSNQRACMHLPGVWVACVHLGMAIALSATGWGCSGSDPEMSARDAQVDAAADSGNAANDAGTSTVIDSGLCTCLPSQKCCGEAGSNAVSCVPTNDVSRGCATASCAPCPAPPVNASSICDTDGSCGFSCNAGFLDCDAEDSNGCETELGTATACGGCGQVCSAEFVTEATCTSSQQFPPNPDSACRVQACQADYGDCNGSFADGCETATLTSSDHCGECGNSCLDGRVCRQGACVGVGDDSFEDLGGFAGATPPQRSFLVAGDSIWFADERENTVFTLPKTGGTRTTVLTASRPRGLATDGTEVFVGTSPGGIQAINITNRSVRVVDSTRASALTVASGVVYFQRPPVTTPFTHPIWSVPVSGGAPVQLIDLAAGASYVAVHDSSVYFRAGNVLGRVPTVGGTPFTQNNERDISAFSIAGGRFYGATNVQAISAPLVDLAFDTFFSVSDKRDLLAGAVSSGGFTYVSGTSEDGSRVVVKVADGATDFQVHLTRGSGALAADENYLYGTNSASGNIWRADL